MDMIKKRVLKRKVTHFGTMIRKKRLELNDTLESAAEKTGLTKSTIHYMENGYQKETTVKAMYKISKGMKIEFDHLLNAYVEDMRAEAASCQPLRESSLG